MHLCACACAFDVCACVSVHGNGKTKNTYISIKRADAQSTPPTIPTAFAKGVLSPPKSSQAGHSPKNRQRGTVPSTNTTGHSPRLRQRTKPERLRVQGLRPKSLQRPSETSLGTRHIKASGQLGTESRTPPPGAHTVCSSSLWVKPGVTVVVMYFRHHRRSV